MNSAPRFERPKAFTRNPADELFRPLCNFGRNVVQQVTSNTQLPDGGSLSFSIACSTENEPAEIVRSSRDVVRRSPAAWPLYRKRRLEVRGITAELGRFVMSYRTIFGESLSTTLQRNPQISSPKRFGQLPARDASDRLRPE
jgi:hypothetical protein